MPLPALVFFAAGGASIVGGLSTGVHLLRRGRQEAAGAEAARHTEIVMDLLRRELAKKELIDQATSAGLNVEAVLAGYQAMLDGQIDVGAIVNRVLSGDLVVATSHEGEGSENQLGSGNRQELAARSEAAPRPAASVVRQWARENGYDVATTGRLANEVYDAYGEADNR